MSQQTPPANLKVYIQHPFARMPIKSSPNDDGYDIHSCEYVTVLAKQWKSIKTGIHFHVPAGWEVELRPRSELVVEKGVTLMDAPSIIDERYIEEVVVVLHNTGEFPFDIAPGDKIAHLVMKPVYKILLTEIDEAPSLPPQ